MLHPHVHSSSIRLRSSLFIALSVNAQAKEWSVTRKMKPSTTARRSDANVSLGGLFVVKMGVLVSCILPPTVAYTHTFLADIGDFLTEEIRGPAQFACTTTLPPPSSDAEQSKPTSSCRFEEPQMNDLIDQIFGDRYITLTCEGGECLREDMVPGYVVRAPLNDP